MTMTTVNVDSLRDTASDTLDQLQRAAVPAIKEGKRQAAVLLDQSGKLIDTVGDHASEAAADLGNALIAYSKKNPLTALLLAIGAGALLIGAAKSMRSSR
jgi:hypothetical protein